MSEEEYIWERVGNLRGIGPKTLWDIAHYLEEKGQTLSWLISREDELERSPLKIDHDDVARIKAGVPTDRGGSLYTVLHPLHPDFPERVKRFNEQKPMPALLYVQGNTALLRRPGIAVIGARDAAEKALDVARETAKRLAGEGVNIISGHAKGVDSAAHLGALEAGGTTTIVPSEGLRRFRLREELRQYAGEENVLLISQFEPDARWKAYFAMERNKLIVALARAVLVVQSGPERDASGKMSGTFNAASFALNVHAPVFIVSPGFFARGVEGNRALIEKGGKEWDPREGVDVLLSEIRSGVGKAEVVKSPEMKKGRERKGRDTAQMDLFEDQ
ncbi:MAG: DNA-processing protein DprA [Bacteroidota bacterium]|nr:DNA-processing protein DprA [Bacteroidota bacterium]